MARAILWLVLAGLLSACGTGLPVAGKPDARTDSATRSRLQPRIVVQVGHKTEVIAVRWINGAAHLLSLALDGSIVVWDVARGTILDTAQVPSAFPDEGDEQYLQLQAFEPAPDGRTMHIAYARGPGADGSDHDACPPAARSGGERWCSFTLDLATRTVRPDATYVPAARFKPFVDNLFTVEEMTEAQRFPPSPDGRWQPRAEAFDYSGQPLGEADPTTRPASGGCVSDARCDYGLILQPLKGGQPQALTARPRGFVDADITPDGQKLVALETDESNHTAAASLFDLSSDSPALILQRSDAYQQVRWLDAGSFLMASAGYPMSDAVKLDEGYPPAVIGDADCMGGKRACRAVPHFTHITAGDGGLLGLGDANECYRGTTPDDLGCVATVPIDTTGQPETVAMSALPPGADLWQPLPRIAGPGEVLTALAVSPDRTKLAVATRQWESRNRLDDRQILRVLLFDLAANRAIGPPVELARIVDRRGRLSEIYNPVGSKQPEKTEELLRNGSLYFDDDMTIRKLSFTPDGAKIFFAQATTSALEATLTLIEAGGTHKSIQVPHRQWDFAAIGATRLLDLATHEIIDTTSGRITARLFDPDPYIRAGFIARGNLIWVATRAGAVKFFDADSLDPVLTLHLLAGGSFFAVAPDGRYDTNLPPDTRAVRWIVPDAPFQSLGPQTFMRDYYEPGLYARLLACRAAGTCAQAFRPLPSLDSLNRVLPTVTISAARPAPDGRAVTVTVDAAEGTDPAAANGKTRSGLFNPRLFVNGQLAAMVGQTVDDSSDSLIRNFRFGSCGTGPLPHPATHGSVFYGWSGGGEGRCRTETSPEASFESDTESWRKANAVGGRRRFVWTVPVPTGADAGTLTIEAYAFNEDRIKSETARFTMPMTPAAPRPRRAYVITIGIDEYEEPRFRLRYAAADARTLSARLARIDGREVRRLELTGVRLPRGGRRVVSKATIANALGLLDPGRNRWLLLASLRRAGFDGSAIEPATPDDLVIVTFSGHGWADPAGNFYLVPTNGGWTDGAAEPNRARLLSSADLVRAFVPLQAGAMALVIDACHSSASVANGRFKPGPMGDAGLGQLAWDKHLMVLAATQADDVARENARLGQGLLTYVLAQGLAPNVPGVDRDGDGAVRLDEWLDHAVGRLPLLSETSALAVRGSVRGGLRFSDEVAAPPPVRVQQPSLFAFHRTGPMPVLRRVRR